MLRKFYSPVRIARDCVWRARRSWAPREARNGLDCVFHVVLSKAPPFRAGLITVADVALLPCGASPADAWALASTLELVREAQILRRELFAYVFMTRIQRATALGRGARAVLSGLGIEVLDAELGYRVTFQIVPPT